MGLTQYPYIKGGKVNHIDCIEYVYIFTMDLHLSA